MLEDFQTVVDDAVTSGLPFKGWLDKNDVYHPGFLDRFDEIVKKHGWDHKGGREWRARVIYETNLKSAYAAGRYSQMTDLATLKVYPYWQYVHAKERIPVTPRPQHVAWDGLILRANDPWWQTYYPPNGWKCGCGVRPVSQAKLERLGKDGPDRSPPIELVQTTDPGSGEPIDYPKGVDMGWAYAPGRTWAEGVVPRELQRPSGRQLTLPKVDPLPALSAIARPFQSELLPDGKTSEFYVGEFLSKFGASPTVPRLFRDKAGQVVVISDDLFRTPTGDYKAMKRGRHLQMGRLAETIQDPDEIWVDFEWHSYLKKWILTRRYIRLDQPTSGFAIFSYGKFLERHGGFPIASVLFGEQSARRAALSS